MLLYHYSKSPYTHFKTLAMQKNITNEEKKKALADMEEYHQPGPYYSHISFFFEPVPVDIIGGLFRGSGNEFWVTGNTIYEHIIDSKELGDFKYMIIETSVDREHRKSWSDTGDEKWYFAEKYRLLVKCNYIGSGNNAFERGALPLVGTTRQAYINTVKNPFDTNSLKKYAADVPHVMIYPTRQTPIRITRPVRSMIIGANDISI